MYTVHYKAVVSSRDILFLHIRDQSNDVLRKEIKETFKADCSNKRKLRNHTKLKKTVEIRKSTLAMDMCYFNTLLSNLFAIC